MSANTTGAVRVMEFATALFLCAACGGGDSEEAVGPGSPAPTATGAAPAPGGETPVTPPGTAPAPAPKPAACDGKAALSGDLEWKLTAGGKERVVHVHVPPSYDRTKAVPVVLSFHGFTSNAKQQDLLAAMSPKADQAGFIAVHAEGLGGSQSWNAGACCGEAASSGVDDVAFVRSILDEVESKLCVDTKRVFATGMSNGGFLSHRLACEMSNRIAAIAPVAGVLGVASCTPVRPMSVFQFHGTLDGLVPYLGNPGLGYPSVSQTMNGWATRSGCTTTARETSNKGAVRCVTYDNCKDGAEVSLCTVTGGGHTWPGGMPVPVLGITTTDIVATDAMWDFFAKHPLP